MDLGLSLDNLARIDIATTPQAHFVDGVEIPGGNVMISFAIAEPPRVSVSGVDINGAFVYRDGVLLCVVPRRRYADSAPGGTCVEGGLHDSL